MFNQIKENLQQSLQQLIKEFFPAGSSIPPIELEIPSDKQHGDLACNIALKSAKIMKKAPMLIAQEMKDAFWRQMQSSTLKDYIQSIEVKNPGFINFHFSQKFFESILKEIIERKDQFGQSDLGKQTKVLLEFVSANPTGPLSIAHARQAAVGDALVNILNFVGCQAEGEYYVNDGGNQINILGQSIRYRAQEILGQSVDFPEDGYQGEYIRDMAQDFIRKNNIKDITTLNSFDLDAFRSYGTTELLDIINKDLEDFGVIFKHWAYESKIATYNRIEELLDYLQRKLLVYKKEGALWFKSTDFGDDKDRVVKKSDGSYTYLTPDIVYHKNKLERGYQKLINIWGPDHHGYIPRLKASVEALGYEAGALEVLIVQLATIYKQGKAVSMSTRRGQYISLREVIDEVGTDAARFFFLMRHINAHLDFDLELAKKQTPENPVYYIQYAHARVYSINNNAREAQVSAASADFTLLKEEEEIQLIKKLGEFPLALAHCYQQLDPFPLVNYLQESAACFHRFYDAHRVIVDDKDLASQRLALVNAARIVLANGLKLLGVSTPEKM
ncbi:MAG: arginine--tRNA ligase [Candidatus Omnitrophica bacterium]|nr:arginine--tRNA ligase [Candidatus Omnitrophota bacterium]MCB9746976.1 arginine--tRNA ligase [Candidatus Omnitrophota bacterium]